MKHLERVGARFLLALSLSVPAAIADVAEGRCRPQLLRPRRRNSRRDSAPERCRATTHHVANGLRARSVRPRTSSTNAHPYPLRSVWCCVNRLNPPYPCLRNGPDIFGGAARPTSLIDSGERRNVLVAWAPVSDFTSRKGSSRLTADESGSKARRGEMKRKTGYDESP